MLFCLIVCKHKSILVKTLKLQKMQMNIMMLPILKMHIPELERWGLSKGFRSLEKTQYNL